MLKFINLNKLTAKTLVGILMVGSLITPSGTRKAVASDGVQGLELRYAESAFQCGSDSRQADIRVEVYEKDNDNLITTLSRGDVYTSDEYDSISDFDLVYKIYNFSHCSGFADGTTRSVRGSMLLGANDAVPSLAGFSGQSSVAQIHSNLDSYEELLLVELGTSNTSSSSYDLQDVVLVVDNNPQSLVDAQNELNIPQVSGDNACILDWSEVLEADPDGWVRTGNNGTRDDLYRVYYHEPSGKHVRVTVNQRWGWGGADGSDSYAKSPKIVDYSRWGTGGFDGEDMFLFSMRTKRNQVNRLTLEFFEDSELTNKSDVSNLNFTLTDLDGKNSSSGRENIIVSAENSFGSIVPIEFYRPEGSVIQEDWINGGSVLGKTSNVTGPEGNIAPVLLGDTHKVEIVYQLAPNSNEADQTRHMYVSDLAWCGEAVNVTPDEEVDIEEIINSDDDDDDTSTTDDSDGNGILDVDELKPDLDLDGDQFSNEEDPDDDGNGILDVDEIGDDPNNPIDTDGDNTPDYQDLDDDNDGIDDLIEIGQYPNNPIDSDNDGIPNYKDDDDDNNGIPNKFEVKNSSNNPGYDVNGDGTPDINPTNSDDDSIPDYLDEDDDNNGIKDKYEIKNDPSTNSGYDLSGDGTFYIYPADNNNNTIPDYLEDLDGDGKQNSLDDDDDGDGIPDSVEIGNADSSVKRTLLYSGSGTNGSIVDIYANDTDDNGTPDYLEKDSDKDGINDSDEYDENDEYDNDADGDGFLNFQDLDSDNNSILDANEGLNSPLDDIDGDTIYDFLDMDDDGDGIIDVIEIGGNPDAPINGYDERNNDNIPDYQDTDSDNDGILDAHEGVKASAPDETTIVIKVVDKANANSTIRTNYKLQDMDPDDTKKNTRVCVDADESTGNRCVVRVELDEDAKDGTVTINNTITGLDSQIYNYAD